MDGMTQTIAVTPVLHESAPGVRVRGTLAVVAGAGETARVYERFGRRIASDGYVVGVFETADASGAAAWLAAHDAAPRVLVGSDAGAAAVLALAVSAELDADGILVAGTPVAGVTDADAAASDRTACPLHLGVLAEPAARIESGGADASASTAAAVPDAADLARIALPVLAFHGGADPIAPLDDAVAALSAIPQLEVVEVVGGLHDALNDQTHRSVAARTVLWLERLRLGLIEGTGIQTPILREVQQP